MMLGPVVNSKKCSTSEPCNRYDGPCANDNECKDFYWCGTHSCNNKGLCCTDGWYTDKVPEEFDIEQGNLLTTFKYMGKAFRVLFDLKLNNVKPRGYLSVLQMTTADKREGKRYGDRNPAIFVKGNKLHIASAINGNKNHNFDVQKPLQAGKWHNIEIRQWHVIDKRQDPEIEMVFFNVTLDKKEVYSIVNEQPKIFENVKLYAGAPFRYEAAKGKIKGLEVDSYLQTTIWGEDIIV